MSPEKSSLSLTDHLRQLEEALLRPELRTSGQFAGLLADDFVEFGSSGRVYDKAAVVALLRTETPGSHAMTDFRATLLAPSVALVTYAIRREASPPVDTLRSSIWQLRDAGWQLVFHQGTRTNAPA
jgi:hypothetical protein